MAEFAFAKCKREDLHKDWLATVGWALLSEAGKARDSSWNLREQAWPGGLWGIWEKPPAGQGDCSRWSVASKPLRPDPQLFRAPGLPHDTESQATRGTVLDLQGHCLTVAGPANPAHVSIHSLLHGQGATGPSLLASACLF